MLCVKVGRNGAKATHQVTHDSPKAAHVVANGDKEVAVVAEGDRRDHICMFVNSFHVVKELVLVQLDHVEDLLCLL